MDHQNQPNQKESASEIEVKQTQPGDQDSSKISGSGDELSQPKELSKEEQMAKFEEAMKNEDWGHQPC